MHVVIWTFRGQRYAIGSKSIAEVIPTVTSRAIPGSEAWLIGVFDYRGHLLPLYDFALLLGQESSEYRRASRILVIERVQGTQPHSYEAGLLVENVLGAETIAFEETQESATEPRTALEFLGPVARTPGGTVQLITPERLPKAAQPFS